MVIDKRELRLDDAASANPYHLALQFGWERVFRLLAERGQDGRLTQFTVEATGHGLNRFDDDYYRHWPFSVTEEEKQSEGYLKSLTPAEELAVFLSIRGMCLREAGRLLGLAAGLAS